MAISTVSITPDPITVSIGACHFRIGNKRPEDLIKLVDEFVAKADNALFEAKDQGRNGFIISEW
ncbi:hypothetical protein [Shewanella atlantica]|uniref:Diguanylate cyclase n=1 Tax=Shewanella atlantica TaxID=271099 RepID=A0A431W9H0_9GAMM|nr:hypothetical protein [Shewanella atlantica]RTR32132.1 hypothetical protein EKG39_11915 [Shewanella atlantica]